MTCSFDQMLEPGERVLERGTRFGPQQGSRLNPIRIATGVMAIWTAVLFADIFGLWSPTPLHSSILFSLGMSGLGILVVLSITCGSYNSDAIITTRRVLVGAAGAESATEELRLANVAEVEFHSGYFRDDFATISGKQGEKFNLRQPVGASNLASAIAAAANLPQPRLPSAKKQLFVRVVWCFYIVLCIVYIVGFIILWCIFTFNALTL